MSFWTILKTIKKERKLSSKEKQNFSLKLRSTYQEILIRKRILTSHKKMLKFDKMLGICMVWITCQMKKLETTSREMHTLKLNGWTILHATLFLILLKKLFKQLSHMFKVQLTMNSFLKVRFFYKLAWYQL